MNILISGDIYLRKEPDYVDYSFVELEEIQMEKNMILENIENSRKIMEKRILERTDLSEENKNKYLEVANEEYDKKIAQLNQAENEMLEKGKVDYEEYKNFWILVCTDNGIQMVEQTEKGQGKVRKYSTAEEMKEDFISLRESLANSEYMGIEFLVPEPEEGIFIITISKDMKNPLGFIATYFIGDRAIIFNKKTNKYELAIDKEILSKTAGQLPFVHDEYRDRSELYQAIFKQIVKGKNKSL